MCAGTQSKPGDECKLPPCVATTRFGGARNFRPRASRSRFVGNAFVAGFGSHHVIEASALAGDTIIGVPFEPQLPLRSLLHDPSGPERPQGDEVSQRLFKIRSADCAGRRSSASILINRMYAGRGYQTTALSETQLPIRITLVATEHEETIGTITIGFDSPAGLNVDDPFGVETNALRDAGHRVCEFTRLAMDSVVRSRRVLASLFHVAYLYAHRMMGFDCLLIEVNPRHVRYYKKMLGFHVLGTQRLNLRVNAQSVLMCLDFSFAHDQIDKLAGQPVSSTASHSLYPQFFSVAEEASIVGRLMRTQPDAVYLHAPISRPARHTAPR